MKVRQVKKVPSRAHRQVQNGEVYWTLYRNCSIFVYTPYVNCFGEHVFVRCAYSLK